VKPIAVSWIQDGSTLRATLPPQPGVSNAVVRVEVRDAEGHDIGRGHLEIAPSPAVHGGGKVAAR
jgi:hypothetical protein